MSVTYASAHLDKLDERFVTESKTDVIVNKGGIRLEFNGKNSVTIYHTDTVAQSDYVRTGSNRFGTLVELGNGTQTFTLSRDKAFTFTVDKGNLEDSMHSLDVAKAVKRQVREVSVPALDVYTLAIATSYAITNSQGVVGGTAVAYNTIYSLILAQQAALSEAEVPEENRTLFITPTNLNLLKRDPEFRRACDTSQNDIKKGIVGMVDGLRIVVCPSSYFVTKFEFMIIWDELLIRASKFNSVRVLTDVQGIDGSVAEGREYGDVFIPGQKAEAVRIYTKA